VGTRSLFTYMYVLVVFIDKTSHVHITSSISKKQKKRQADRQTDRHIRNHYSVCLSHGSCTLTILRDLKRFSQKPEHDNRHSYDNWRERGQSEGTNLSLSLKLYTVL